MHNQKPLCQLSSPLSWQVSVRQSQLLNSSATTGAAMHCEGNTTVSIDGCSLVGNTAKAVAGGLYMVFGANVS